MYMYLIANALVELKTGPVDASIILYFSFWCFFNKLVSESSIHPQTLDSRSVNTKPWHP